MYISCKFVRILCKLLYLDNILSCFDTSVHSFNLNYSAYKSSLGVVHIIRKALRGRGKRFVTKPFKNIGICRVLRYE